MISYLQGQIIKKGGDFAVVKAGPVGYKAYFSQRNLDLLVLGQEVEVFTSFVLKRDDFELYGFLSGDELELFETLNRINGVGPKAALKITSLGSFEELKAAVDSNNGSFFAKVKGIGNRTIQKVFLELSGKIKSSSFDNGGGLNYEERQIVDTMCSLGFAPKDAISAVKKIPADVSDLKERIRICLQFLKKN